MLNGGTEYNSPPQLKVLGSGKGSKIIPILKAGSIDSVTIVHSGIGYTSSDVSVKVTPNGDGADLYCNPKTWTINTVERLIQNDQITSDDGVVSVGLNEDYGLEYSHLYAPRKLRQSTYAEKSIGDKQVFVPDLILEEDIEKNSINHSPIIGWSYDGSPIYGPYGYTKSDGGPIKILESGYSASLSTERPNPLTSSEQEIYPLGFFVEDYSHQPDKDLDEHNGRFCKTPEYPNGVYAYFSTINPQSLDSDGAFKNYRKPQFPYFIGESYKHETIEYNFKFASNQDDVNLNGSGLSRNTAPYNFLFNDTEYEFLVDPNKIYNQKSYVRNVSSGKIQNVGVSSGGIGYKVGDSVIFDTDTGGYGARASVKDLDGKTVNQVSIANSEFSNVEFILKSNGLFVGYTTVPHNFYVTDLISISGLNTSGLVNNSVRACGVATDTFKLFAGVGTAAATGIVTYFSLDPNVKVDVISNDVLGIGTEKVKVLNIDSLSSIIRVLRQHDSTTGSAHTANSLISQNPRTLSFSPDRKVENSNFRLNNELYFNPTESIGLGTISGVGIGSTLVFSNPGTGISEIFIPTKSLYFKNHGLDTGDALTYRTNVGTAISVSTDGIDGFALTNGQTVYAAKITQDLIGIATARVGVGSTGSWVGINSSVTTST